MIQPRSPARDLRDYLELLDRIPDVFRNAWDAVAIYGPDRRLIAGNAAASGLAGDGLGGAWSREFAACLETEAPVDADGAVRASDGTLVPVRMRFVPARVDGTTVGVLAFARDTRPDRDVRRITALYRVAAAPVMSADEKIRSTLELARAELGAGSAYFGRIVDGHVEATHVCGDEPADAAPGAGGTPVIIDGESYGEIGFENDGAPLPLTCGDREFVTAIAALVGAAVQQGAHEKRLDTLAFYDALTGLPNRSLFHDRLERTLLAARRNRRSFAVHYIDIDHFKMINDTYGHHIGDGVLVAVAGWLQSTLRDSDTVARLGGDEFVVLQPEVDSIRQAEELAAKLAAIREHPLRIGDYEIVVRLSVGVAVFPSGRAQPVDMLRAADATLYDVKRHGRDGYKVGLVR